MKKNIGNIIKFVLFLALAIVLMYFAFKDIKFSDLIDGIKSANYFLVALSVAIGILGYIVRTFRWKMLIDALGQKVPLKNVYTAMMTGYLFNFAIPRIGEITRCGILRKTENIPFEKLFGTVIIERCYDVLVLICSVVFVFFIRIDVFGKFISEKIGSVVTKNLSYMPIAVIVAIVAIIILTIVLLIVFRKKIKQLPIAQKIKKIAKGLLEGFATGFRIKNGFMFFIYTIIIYLCYWFTGYFIIKALPVTQHLGLLDSLFLFVIGGLGWLVPVQGGFGSYHFLVAMGLGLYGISWQDGIIFATISHESQVIFMIIIGLISFITVLLSMKKKNIKNIKI